MHMPVVNKKLVYFPYCLYASAYFWNGNSIVFDKPRGIFNAQIQTLQPSKHQFQMQSRGSSKTSSRFFIREHQKRANINFHARGSAI